jgi:hypothetical protein
LIGLIGFWDHSLYRLMAIGDFRQFLWGESFDP